MTLESWIPCQSLAMLPTLQHTSDCSTPEQDIEKSRMNTCTYLDRLRDRNTSKNRIRAEAYTISATVHLATRSSKQDLPNSFLQQGRALLVQLRARAVHRHLCRGVLHPWRLLES